MTPATAVKEFIQEQLNHLESNNPAYAIVDLEEVSSEFNLLLLTHRQFWLR